jgi:hypothetical protein
MIRSFPGWTASRHRPGEMHGGYSPGVPTQEQFRKHQHHKSLSHESGQIHIDEISCFYEIS